MEERFKLISAVHIFVIKDHQILLLRRFNTGFADGQYSVVAGHLDGNEEIKTAAIREAKEEAGIIIKPDDIQVVGVMHRISNDERIDFFLTTKRWLGEIKNMEPHKCDRLEWFDMNSLPENIVPYVKKAIENFQEGRWFDSYGW